MARCGSRTRFVGPRLFRFTALLVGSGVVAPVAAGGAVAQETSGTQTRQDRQEAGEATPADVPDDDIVVTGERVGGYAVPIANAATKVPADTLELPVSVQAVPRELIDDINAVRLADIIQYSSGVFIGSQTQADGDNLIIRGFQADSFLRDGYPYRNRSIRDPANVQRVEILKGPASVLYGRLEPGGTINYVTARPLDESFGAATTRVDQYGLVRVTGDISLINSDRDLGLRVTVAGENGPTFRNFSFSDRLFAAASGLWRIGPRTRIDLDFEYLYDKRTPDRAGIPIVDGAPAPVPRSRIISEPDDFRTVDQITTGYIVNHELGGRWTLRHALRYNGFVADTRRTQPRTSSLFRDRVTLVYPNGDIDRSIRVDATNYDEIVGQLEAIGEFNTGSQINHKVLVGIEGDRSDYEVREFRSPTNVPSNRINIFKPIYGRLNATTFTPSEDSNATVRSFALYAQDLIRIADRFNVLVGGRYDKADTGAFDRLDRTETSARTSAFSPRAGVVYQPTPNSSIYASYAQSFVPQIGQDFDGNLFDPTQGRQFEAGAKARLLGGRITTSGALFRIRKTNVAVDDPDNPGFDIQVGEIESKGLEVDVGASPIDGLNLIANMSYADVKIRRDTRPLLLGTRPNNVPDWGAAAFVSYEVQRGPIRGLGAGLGISHQGARHSSNSGRDVFTVAGYERIDVNIWYDRDRWRLSARIGNVLDKRYVESTSNGGVRFGTPANLAVQIGRTF